MKRFRLIAGPNGSGKTTLRRQLAADYAVNFYATLCADDVIRLAPEAVTSYAGLSAAVWRDGRIEWIQGGREGR